MKKFDYKSEKEWCIAFKTIEDAGIEPPKEMLEQYAIFTATQNSSSIFDTLRSISKFPYSAELVECITSTVDNLLINSENAIEPGLLL